MEAEINYWFKDNSNILVSHVKQSYTFDANHAFYTLISIWYTIR